MRVFKRLLLLNSLPDSNRGSLLDSFLGDEDLDRLSFGDVDLEGRLYSFFISFGGPSLCAISDLGRGDNFSLVTFRCPFSCRSGVSSLGYTFLDEILDLLLIGDIEENVLAFTRRSTASKGALGLRSSTEGGRLRRRCFS
jgi:hypothetical protein